MAMSPDGSNIFITNQSAEVWVFATATNTVTARILVASMGPSDGVAVSPDGSKVYVTIRQVVGNGTLSVIDTVTNKVTAAIPVGTVPYGVAVTPDSSKVYVANVQSNTVSVIDTKTNTVTATIPVGSAPVAFGVFIQPAKSAPKFAGTPGKSNCYGKSVSALVRQYHGLNAAAAALGDRSVKALQTAIMEFCEG